MFTGLAHSIHQAIVHCGYIPFATGAAIASGSEIVRREYMYHRFQQYKEYPSTRLALTGLALRTVTWICVGLAAYLVMRDLYQSLTLKARALGIN